MAKEDQDKPITLRLKPRSAPAVPAAEPGFPGYAEFEAEKNAGDLRSVVYERSGDTLTITVNFVQEPSARGTVGVRAPLIFTLRRVAALVDSGRDPKPGWEPERYTPSQPAK